MLNALYEFIDKLWQKLSNLIFVRFAFDIPVDSFPQVKKTRKLVFCLTHGGLIEWLILSSWCRKNGLGAILVANRKKILFLSKPLYFLQTIFTKRTLSDLFLSQEQGPRLIFCPPGERKELFKPTETEGLIADLYNFEKQSGEEMCFVFIPVFICWRKHLRGTSRQLSEYFLGLSSRPNFFGKIWYLARKRTDSTVRALTPILFSATDPTDISDDIDGIDATRMARMVRRKVLVEISQEMRIVLGPRYFSPYLIKENIMRDPQILQLVDQISKDNNTDKRKVMGQAYTFLTEIAANYTFRFVEVMYGVLTWLFGKIFEDVVVDPNQVQSLRETLKTRSAVFVSCHRSHLDYMVVPGVLFVQDIVTPHIAAGVNLSFWPVGPFLRMGGAFFIRRSFRGEPLYALCLQKYIDWLIKNRINIKFFIEGTRSRTGKMLPPAYGLLKMVLNTFQQGQIEDLALIPISISYDEVLEEKSYGKELAGAQKEKESAKGLVQSRKLFQRNIGKVYVRFAPGISVKGETQLGTDQGLDSTLMLQKLAFQICKSINDVTPVTPKSILASVLLSHERNSLSLEEILRASHLLGRYATWSRVELSCGDEPEQLKRAVESNVKKLLGNQTLQSETTVPVRYFLEERKRINMVFYKNNAIHCFVIPSITSLSMARSQGQQRDQILKHAFTLRNIFKFEFFFSPSSTFSDEISRNIDYLNQPVFTGDHSVFLRLNRDLIESYLIAFETIQKEAIGEQEVKTALQKVVREAVLRVEENKGFATECVSTQNFTNAFKLMENIGLLEFKRDSEQVLIILKPWNEEASSILTELRAFYATLMNPPGRKNN
jgi:glycerol-3-phosphate O-acyltransferase